MYAVWLGVILLALKWSGVSLFKDMSWWWVFGPLSVAFIYFEVLEPLFGWDKKKAHDEADEYKQKRLKQQLKRTHKKY